MFGSVNRGSGPGRNRGNMPKPKDKPFAIPKPMVREAYRRVAANKGAPGVDEVTLGEFEADLENNLYRIWNRMSSGSYFPPPVRAGEIPKPHGGGVRVLGVPTIADRIAQTVVAMYLEPLVEPRFHPDSYGYRPGKAALDAVETCRRRCWKFDWVIDLDVQEFFDTVRWDLVVKVVEAVTDCRWVLLYVKRWLAAPLQHPDGTPSRARQGHSAGIGGFAGPREPVPALRLRSVDGPEVPGLPLRAVRRRRRRALQEQAAGGVRAGQDRTADAGGGPPAPPRQDEDRLLL